MPLKCLRDGQEIYAFNITDDSEWKKLRALNVKTKCLRMHCCPSTVVLKTSRLGTRYFAHTRRGECTTAPESEEHLLAKATIAAGILRTTWAATAEQYGKTPSGEKWAADVMAKRRKGKSVVFEVQWSRQTEDETYIRQARYVAAAVRGMWFFRQHDFPMDKGVPAFRLRFNEKTKLFHVLVPSHRYDGKRIKQRDKDEPHYWLQTVELSRFVEGALKGHLHFAPVLNKRLPLEVYAATKRCWRCHRKTKLITELMFAVEKVLPHCPNIHASIYSLEDLFYNGTNLVNVLLPTKVLRKHGIGSVKKRYSKTEKQTYLSNGCVHCDALQDRSFDDDVFYYDGEDELEFSVDVLFEEELAKRLGVYHKYIYYWWFDDSFEPSVNALRETAADQFP